MLVTDSIRFGFDFEEDRKTSALIKQVHGTRIIQIQNEQHAAALIKQREEADGVYTTVYELPIFVFTADCLPIIFYGETAESPVGVIHCGWRGAKDGIAREMVRLFARHKTPVHAVLGPAIGPCCFEVREDFIGAFKQSNRPVEPFLENRNNKLTFNLPAFVVETDLGSLVPSHVHLDHFRCTVCSKPDLPSYRRLGKTDPRIRTWVKKVTNQAIEHS
ncbi:MAG: polyphenol oxidase family protein [Deltaproteobacteria bacterium]|nr:polyphenol oxidase family protein [Deltaproteobacteria bacterium]